MKIARIWDTQNILGLSWRGIAHLTVLFHSVVPETEKCGAGGKVQGHRCPNAWLLVSITIKSPGILHDFAMPNLCSKWSYHASLFLFLPVFQQGRLYRQALHDRVLAGSDQQATWPYCFHTAEKWRECSRRASTSCWGRLGVPEAIPLTRTVRGNGLKSRLEIGASVQLTHDVNIINQTTIISIHEEHFDVE